MAATIFSVIAVGIAGTFFSGIKLWQRISGVNVSARFMRVDLQKLGKDLQGGIDLPLIGYAGSATAFSFPSLENGRVVKVVYAFDAGQKKLMRRSSVFHPAEDEGNREKMSTEGKVLEADELRFMYLDPSVQDAVEWLDAWPKENGMFRAMRVEGAWKGEPFSKIIIIPRV
jgi:hypothetical protein